MVVAVVLIMRTGVPHPLTPFNALGLTGELYNLFEGSFLCTPGSEQFVDAARSWRLPQKGPNDAEPLKPAGVTDLADRVRYRLDLVVLSLFVSLPEELRLRNEVRHPASWLSLSSGTSAAAGAQRYQASVVPPLRAR